MNQCSFFAVFCFTGWLHWNMLLLNKNWQRNEQNMGHGYRFKLSSINEKPIIYRFLYNEALIPRHHLEITAGPSVRSIKKLFKGTQRNCQIISSARSRSEAPTSGAAAVQKPFPSTERWELWINCFSQKAKVNVTPELNSMSHTSVKASCKRHERSLEEFVMSEDFKVTCLSLGVLLLFFFNLILKDRSEACSWWQNLGQNSIFEAIKIFLFKTI